MALVLQKVENLFIAPRVMSRKVSISPLAVFIAFMIGASLLGIIGAIIADPGRGDRAGGVRRGVRARAASGGRTSSARERCRRRAAH